MIQFQSFLLASVVVAAVAAIGLLAVSVSSCRRSLPLPPAPKGLPLLGNALQLRLRNHPWKAFDEWSKQYGGLFSLNLAGKTFIVIGSVRVAHDLLNKRAIKSSTRPPMTMANDLVTKGMHILIRPYDANYRLHQRMQAPALSLRAATSYAKIYELKSKHLLFNLLNDGPEPDFVKHLYTCNLGVVYALIYGIDIKTGQEKCINDARAVQKAFGRVTTPGAYIVDMFPFLNMLPNCLAPWKQEAEDMYQEEEALHFQNFNAGLAAEGWTFAKQFAGSPEAKQLSKVEVAYSLGMLIHAAWDTMAMQLEWFIVACLTYPDCVAKAQAALDEVVGHERLPMLSDKPDLPYITAMVDEVPRWRSILNGGFPHYTTEEDEYNGYRIPKDAILLPCFWSIDHDETFHKDPLEFVPERWLYGGSEFKQPAATFGFGRRACTGQNISRNNLWTIVARLLWAFEIKYALDEQGNEIKVDPTATATGFNTNPVAFKARFVPRGDWSKKLIESEWRVSDKNLANYLKDIEKMR